MTQRGENLQRFRVEQIAYQVICYNEEQYDKAKDEFIEFVKTLWKECEDVKCMGILFYFH